MARPGAVSSSGRTGLTLARCSRASSRAGPTASSASTAGMLSDWVSACRTVTVPRLKPSKLTGT